MRRIFMRTLEFEGDTLHCFGELIHSLIQRLQVLTNLFDVFVMLLRLLRKGE